MTKVCIITGSRADWSGLGMVAVAMRAAGGFDVQALATHTINAEETAMIAAEVGRPPEFHFDARPLETAINVADRAADVLASVARALVARRPDLVLLAGDRYETLAAATAAAMQGIPIAHLAGGDITTGSLDDRYRDAITALAWLHFPTNKLAAERLGPWGRTVQRPHVYCTGSPALDRIRQTPVLSRADTFAALGLLDSPVNVVAALHPTIGEDPAASADQLCRVLNRLGGDVSILLLGSNADVGGSLITRRFLEATQGARRAFRDNLAPPLYYSVLRHFSVLVGNSSAGLYEAPCFAIPVVNIGERQAGRVRALNVVSVPNKDYWIEGALRDAISGKPRTPVANPYGSGHAAPEIVRIIRKVL